VDLPVAVAQPVTQVTEVTDASFAGSIWDFTVATLIGKVSGNVMTWLAQLTKPLKMTLKCEVRVRGAEVSGFASAGILGKNAIVGTRRAPECT